MVITKWGFGSAPFKLKTLNNNKKALGEVKKYILGLDSDNDVTIINKISIVKGLFNRIIRQDQWDWFTVDMFFDYPRAGEASRIAKILGQLRSALVNNQINEVEKAKKSLISTNFFIYVENFMDFDKEQAEKDQYVYILSRREEKDLLKIGMTSRNVIKRVQEINAATGVLYPFAPRRVFRVNDCKKAEKLIHQNLSEFRVREDREFFVL